MKRLSGFSLMEMMVVLLIVAVVAAASAPMVNKKMLSSASERSPWVWTGLNNSIAYNLTGNANQTAIVGDYTLPNGVLSRFHIKSVNDTDGNPIPHMTFGFGNVVSKLILGNSNVILSQNDTTGPNNVVIGATASSQHTDNGQNVVIGANATSTSKNSVVIGYDAKSEFKTGQDYSGIAIGVGARALSTDSLAIGRGARNTDGSVEGVDTHQTAIGTSAKTEGYRAIALGRDSQATNTNALALGAGTRVSASDAIGIGSGKQEDDTHTKVTAANGIAIGHQASSLQSDGDTSAGGAIAIGAKASATDGALVIGNSASSSSNNAIVIGSQSTAASGSIAIGSGEVDLETPANSTNASASGVDAVAIGRGSNAGGESAVAIGVGADVSNDESIAIGISPSTTGDNAIAIGSGTAANPLIASSSAVAIGTGASANNNRGIAIGCRAVTSGLGAVVIGGNSQQSASAGQCSVALGDSAVASDQEAIALGYNASAANEGSIVIGPGARAGIKSGTKESDNFYNIAIGANASTSSKFSVAIGANTSASGICSMAIGEGTYLWDSEKPPTHTMATHDYSIAIGPGAKTTNTNQIVLGNPDTTVYIPGNIVIDGNSVISRKQHSVAFYRMYNADGGQFTRLQNINIKPSDNKLLPGGSYDGDRTLVPWTGQYDPTGIYHNIDGVKKSDRRLKNVGEVFTAGLDEIKKLEVFNYTFKKDPDKTPRVGVMAQDLQKIFPNAVHEGEDGFLRIRMEDMFYALVNAVKQLDAKIEEFKNNQFAQLLDRVSVLEKQNKKQEELNSKQAEMIEKLIKQNEEIIELNKELRKQNKELAKKLKKEKSE